MENLSSKTQVNIQKWLDIIRRCRDSGLTNQKWCSDHGISLKSYYYWLSKIRKLAIEELPRKIPPAWPLSSQGQEQPATTFVPLKIQNTDVSGTITAKPIVIRFGPAVIELAADLPPESLQTILQAVIHYAG